MAGDNVVIMGSLASGLPERDRRKVLLFGVGMALVFLITFAVIATQLLQGHRPGLRRRPAAAVGRLQHVARAAPARSRSSPTIRSPRQIEGPPRTKTFLQAAIQITVADLSMSLDNVLLVASIARDKPALLFIGLTFSVLFMGLAANYVARLIQRYHWINYIGLAVILWVACNMIYEGWVGGEHVLGLRTRARARLGRLRWTSPACSRPARSPLSSRSCSSTSCLPATMRSSSARSPRACPPSSAGRSS